MCENKIENEIEIENAIEIKREFCGPEELEQRMYNVYHRGSLVIAAYAKPEYIFGSDAEQSAIWIRMIFFIADEEIMLDLISIIFHDYADGKREYIAIDGYLLTYFPSLAGLGFIYAYTPYANPTLALAPMDDPSRY